MTNFQATDDITLIFAQNAGGHYVLAYYKEESSARRKLERLKAYKATANDEP
jgi:hypothetical protein